jgi:hypothetical protein
VAVIAGHRAQFAEAPAERPATPAKVRFAA